MKWIGEHRINQNTRFGTKTKVYLPSVLDPGSDTDKFLVSGTGGLLGYRTGAEVLADIGGLPTSTNILAFDGSTANGVCTYKDADEISVESTLTYDSETLTIGADDNGTAFIKRLPHSDDAGGILQVIAGSATNGQTNKAGGDLRLGGGQSTGSGAGGSVTLYTSPAAGSGSAMNNYTNSWVFGADGSFTTEGGITTGSTSFVNSSGVVQVAAQTNITSLGTLTALDVDNININGDTITASGNMALVATGNDISIDTDVLTIESSSFLSPFVTLKSTGSNAFASYMSFVKQRDDDSPADNDSLGTISFAGEDTGGGFHAYGSIAAYIAEADHGDEAGKIQIKVANDGVERNGITMSGDKGTAAEVDVTIANGAASTTTIAGTLTMGSTAALTNAGLVAVANQSNITGVGTISSGVWEGTTIKTAYIGDDQVTEDKLANTLLAEIDANTAKVTNSDQTKADINALDITEVGTIDSGVWNGTVIASAYLDADTAHLTTDQTFTGIKQVNLRKFPISSGTDGDAVGDVVYFGGTTSMTIGTIYHYKSDGTWEAANANAVATSDGLLGVALGAASDTNGMLLRGMVTLDHDPGAVGDVLYLSNTAGDASASAPSDNNDIVRVIGYCLHASSGMIWFNPDNTFVEVTA